MNSADSAASALLLRLTSPQVLGAVLALLIAAVIALLVARALRLRRAPCAPAGAHHPPHPLGPTPAGAHLLGQPAAAPPVLFDAPHAPDALARHSARTRSS